MRVSNLLLCLCLTAGLTSGTLSQEEEAIVKRQDDSNTSVVAPPLPILTSSGDASSSPTPTPSASKNGPTSSIHITSSQTPQITSSLQSNSTTSTQSDPTSTTSQITTPTNGTQHDTQAVEQLPLEPRITVAFCFTGVVLLLTGLVYGIIGIKNRWVHVFLSTGYLTSLSILILIVYVMNPPVSDAIEGAYFVGIFMTGLIFGCGALIFKEVTEGLGCLLGGFCLAMWFMTLKPGGLIDNDTGTAIFIAIFCVVCWALSFSQYTRTYALMGSTSFAGATAFILGADCFSQAGLKEFWVYIWDLNDNIFPLNTNTYPITRGMRVESIVIVLGTIIGLISQVKLWTIVRKRRKEQEATRAEDAKEREAVEEAIGRHLQRQNDRDRTEWEKRYGERLRDSKRMTVSWHDAHPEKRFSTVSAADLNGSQGSSSTDSVEMTSINNNPGMRTSYGGQKGKRQSMMTVQAIPEADEDEIPLRDEDLNQSTESVLLEKANIHSSTSTPRSNRSPAIRPSTLQTSSSENLRKQSSLPSLRPQSEKPTADDLAARLNLDSSDQKGKKRSSFNNFKRRSMQGLLSKSPVDGDKRKSGGLRSPTPTEREMSESKEALVIPTDLTSHHSRASSVAATIDEDNEPWDLPGFEPTNFDIDNICSIGSPQDSKYIDGQLGRLVKDDDEIDEEDPEELVRSPKTQGQTRHGYRSNRTSQEVSETNLEDGTKSISGFTHNSEALTRGALQRVPSQLSHVVMSYRTNEWAKHIAEAEMPLHEEPEPVTNDDQEAPTHLTDPKRASATEQEQVSVEKPPELPSPITAVAPSTAGIKVNPEIQPLEKEYASPSVEIPSLTLPKSRPLSGEHLSIQKTTSTSTTPELQSTEFSGIKTVSPNLKRSATDPTAPRTTRRLSNPKNPQNLATVPIDENHAVEFARITSNTQDIINRNTSNRSTNPYQNYGGSTPDLNRSLSTNNYPNIYQQRAVSSSNLAQNMYQDLSRSSSVVGSNNYPGLINQQQQQRRLSFGSTGNSIYNGDIGRTSQIPYTTGVPPALLRSTTRLSEIENSHQPTSRYGALANDTARREALMAEWRMTNHNQAAMIGAPKINADTRRNQMLMDREYEIRRREREQTEKMMREAAFDQGMRSQSMIEAHREMMRKMQSQVNKKL